MMFGGDPNDPNGDVQKLLGCGCLIVVICIAVIVFATWRAVA